MTTQSALPQIGIEWECTPFRELTPERLYAAMELRQRVFVVDQNCAYMDADGFDQQSHHLFGWSTRDETHRLIAYARLLPPGVKYAEPSVGRVVTHPDVRRNGTGQALMAEALSRIGTLGWGSDVKIAAQMYLERFYERFGFRRVSDPYTEDDIWHVDMLRD